MCILVCISLLFIQLCYLVPYTVVILKKNSLKHLHSCRALVAELQYIIDNIIYLLALIPGQPGSFAMRFITDISLAIMLMLSHLFPSVL